MKNVRRRSVFAGTLGLAATGLTAPFIVYAAAKSATVWASQGFVQQEEAAFKKTVAEYEKATGNRIEYSIMPFMALNQ